MITLARPMTNAEITREAEAMTREDQARLRLMAAKQGRILAEEMRCTDDGNHSTGYFTIFSGGRTHLFVPPADYARHAELER